MSSKNISYLHQLIFAVGILILISSNGQIKNCDIETYKLLMKFAAAVSCLGIFLLCSSFYPAYFHQIKTEELERHEQDQVLKLKRLNSRLEIKENDLKENVDQINKTIGYLSCQIGKYHWYNVFLTNFSLLFVGISALLFGMGTCLQ